MSRLAIHIRIALLVGLIGGTLLGLEQGLLLLESNAGIQIPGYVGVNLALALVTTTAASCLVMVALSLAGYAVAAKLEQERLPALYTSAFAFIAVGVLGCLWLAGYREALARVGAPAFLALLLSAAIWTGAATAAALASYRVAERLREWAGRASAFRVFATACLSCQLIALFPLGRFAYENWRLPLLGEAGTPAAQADIDDARPSILLITIDTLRADRLSAWGGPAELTPNLNRLADEGAAFLTAISPSSWTLPAVASIMTGMIPSRHDAGWSKNGLDILARSPIRSDVTTLAEALSQAGCFTGAIVTNPFLSARYGIDRGFQRFTNLSIESEAGQLLRQAAVYRLLDYAAPELLATDTADVVTNRAIKWLKHAPRPFFLWVHYVDPHAPYGLPAHVKRNTFRGDTLLLRTGLPARDRLLPRAAPGAIGPTFHEIARLRSGEIQLSAAQRRQLIALYDAEVHFVDREIGRLLAHVNKGQTVIAVTADHGEEFWEHGGVEHGHTLYDEVIRVALILSGNRLEDYQGRKVKPQVRLTDLAPTLLDLLGLPAPPPHDGQSLLGLLGGKDEKPRPAVSEAMLFAAERRAVRTANWKYIKWENGKEELYELARDPLERRDRAADATALARAQEQGAMFEVMRRRVGIAREPTRHLTRAVSQVAPSGEANRQKGGIP